MNQEIYDHVMELLNDLMIFKGYQIADKEEFCKAVAQRISDDKVSSVVFGEMDGEIEDLIDDVYFGRDNERKNDIKLESDVDTSEFDALLSIFNTSKKMVDDNKKKVDIQSDKETKLMETYQKLYGINREIGSDKNSLALNHVLDVVNSSGYTFMNNERGVNFSYIEQTAKSILNIHFSKDQYDDIINGMYDDQISQLAIFRSVEFLEMREELLKYLEKNEYYQNYKQLFNSKIKSEIVLNAAIVLLSARKVGIELSSQQVVDEVILKTVFPYGTGHYKEPLADKVDNFKKMMKFTEGDLAVMGVVAFGMLSDMAIPAIILPIIAYTYENGLKVSNDEQLQQINNNSKSR